MEVRAHPTHHDKYRPGRVVWGVVVGLAGVFVCVFALMADPGEPGVLRVVQQSVLVAGELAFVGGTLLAIAIETAHMLARCPSCGRRIFRRRVDRRQSYYPCRRCQVTWTCPCRAGRRST